MSRHFRSRKLGMFRLCSAYVLTFSTKVGYVSTVIDLCLDFLDQSWECFDCARPMSRLSRPKLGMFRLCSTYVSTFSTKVGYVSTVLDLCLDFLDKSWVCFDCARPMSRLSRPKLGMFRLCSTYASTFSTKLGMFRLCSTYVSTFSTKVGYVWTVLGLCTRLSRQSWDMFRLCSTYVSTFSRKLGMFRLCSTYVSTFSTKVGNVSTVLDLCLDFLDQSWVCFDCARPRSQLYRPKLGMFRLCSKLCLATFSTKVGTFSSCARNYVSIFSIKVEYVLSVLFLCLDFLDQSWACFDCARIMSRLSRPKLGHMFRTVLGLCLDFLDQSWVCFDCARPLSRLSRPKLGHVSTVLDLCLDFRDQSRVCLDCARPKSRLSRPKLGMFRLCATYVSTFSIKVGYVLTVLVLCLDFLDQSWACFDCARIMSRLSRPKLGMFRLCSAYVLTFSTKVGFVSTVLDLCLDFLDQSWVCFDCARPMSRLSRPKLGMFRLCSTYVSTLHQSWVCFDCRTTTCKILSNSPHSGNFNLIFKNDKVRSSKHQ